MYIEPTITIHANFEDADTSMGDALLAPSLFGRTEEAVGLDAIARATRNLIVGEPGVGKTVLLRRLKDHLHSSQPVQLVELKSRDALSQVNAFVRNQQGNDAAILLDALDEIGAGTRTDLLRHVDEIGRSNPRISIHLTSRWAFVTRHSPIFTGYRIVAISPFSRAQVREYLLRSGCSEAAVASLLRRVSFGHERLVVQIPRYLVYLTELFQEKGLEAALAASRNDLFEYFIYKQLDLENKKQLTADNKTMLKRTLEKLALTMEIYQDNRISQDDLMTFFDEVQSDLKQLALSQTPLSTFLDYSLLKAGPDTVEFDNTEFQEYLAAKEISRFAEPSRAAFAFAASNDAKEIHPTWFNALTFLVDMEPRLLGQLVEYSGLRATTHLRVVDERFLELLSRVTPAGLSPDQRRLLFLDILRYHEQTLQWLSPTVYLAMPGFFDPGIENELKQSVSRALAAERERRWIPLANIASLVGALLETGQPLDRTFWKEQLIAFASDGNDDGVMQRNALLALSRLGDPTVIDQLPDLTGAEELLAREFLSMCAELAPDHPKSLEYSIRAVASGNSDGRPGLSAIATKESVARLLGIFVSDDEFRLQFLDGSSIWHEADRTLAKRIGTLLDTDLAEMCRQAILVSLDDHTGHHAERSEFLRGLWQILRAREPDTTRAMLQRICALPHPELALHYAREILADVLDEDDVPSFLDAMGTAGRMNSALHTLSVAGTTRGDNGRRLFEAARIKSPTACAQWEQQREEYQASEARREVERRQKVVRRFREYLEPEPGKFSHGVFQFFNENAEALAAVIEPNDRARLTSLVMDTVFRFVEPRTGDLTVTEETPGGGTTYTVTGGIPLLRDAMRTARLLGLNVAQYRQKVIDFIPFAYGDDLKTIFELVPDVVPTELEHVLAVYREKKSDLWRHQTTNVVDLAERLHLVAAAPILRGIATDGKATPFARERALRVAEALRPDKDFLADIARAHGKSKAGNDEHLSVVANGLLITQHADADAIGWRFDEVRRRARPFKRIPGVHSVGEFEEELRSMTFATPLIQLTEPGQQARYLSLLDHAATLWEKGSDYYEYAQYLWNIVYGYFDNLKLSGYAPLHLLERHINALKRRGGTNWLAQRMVALRRSYLGTLGKPQKFSSAVALYNDVRRRQGARILTSSDLYFYLCDAFDTDLRRWIEGEGGYRLLLERRLLRSKKREYEKLVQTTLKTQIDNILLRRHCHTEPADILREPQLLDDKRPDFIVRYGFAGPIVVEVKLTSNSDLKPADFRTTQSYKSMRQYLDGFGAQHGVVLVIANEGTKHVSKIHKAFAGLPINVMLFDPAKAATKPTKKRGRRSAKPRPRRRVPAVGTSAKRNPKTKGRRS